MNDYPHVSEGILGENDIPKTNTELFLSLVNQYFPEAIKDGEVDFTALREEMGEFAEVSAEHYDFTWAGKQAAKKEAQADIFGKTLRYKKDDSKNPDTTENLYIEGDNLEALKLLRRNYHGKIKMIYIDPPYNTGNDFVYHDDFSMTEEELAELSGNVVNDMRFQKNTKDSARYHTNWLNMMYPRLKVARELLADDGVIFISIDDNEVANLRKICDEVFGKENYLCLLPRITKKAGKSTIAIANNNDFLLIYSKSNNIKFNLHSHTDEGFKNSDEYVETRGLYKLNQPLDYDSLQYSPSLDYPIEIDNEVFYPGASYEKYIERKNGKYARADWAWRWSKELFDFGYQNGFIVIKKTANGSRIYTKTYQKAQIEKTETGFKVVEIERTKPLSSLEFVENEYSNDNAKKQMISIFESSPFDYSKPISLLKYIISFSASNNDIILDFFSGSSTTAHAVMQLNAEDGGHRKFIMVQLPEICDEKSEAAKAGYKNICEIGKERIRRAGEKIHNDNPQAVFDDGFKVFEVGNTNIRWNTANDDEFKKLEDFDFSTGNKDDLDFTPGHNDIDIVYEIMLRQHGIPLSTPIEKLSDISDRTYIFADAVVVCLEPEIDGRLIEKLSSIEPTPARFILRDSAFNDDIELKDVSFRKLSALIRNHQTAEERKNKYNNFTVEFI